MRLNEITQLKHQRHYRYTARLSVRLNNKLDCFYDVGHKLCNIAIFYKERLARVGTLETQ